MDYDVNGEVKRRTTISKEPVTYYDRGTQTPVTMTPLRSAASRIKILLIGICVLGIYHVNVETPHPQPQRPEIEIKLEELEQELMTGSRKTDVEFKSPFSDEFFYGNRPVSKKTKLDLKGIAVKREPLRKVEEKITQKYNELWSWADKSIVRGELYSEGPEVDTILDALATAVIVHVDVLSREGFEAGTSEKWLLTLEGGQKAVMKIVWEEMGKMKKGGLCNLGYEMPGSEIAGFHLHRILGFRNTPFVTGRKISIAREILPVASPEILQQIKQEVGKDPCVIGKCFFCEKEDLLCPAEGIIEASVSLWIPRPLKLYTSPPGYMPYSTPRMEEWGKYGFNNRTYCNKLQKDIVPYERSWFYYDLFDFSVLDTLMYHYDSKHYVIYDDSSARGLTVRLDHGRAFCASDRDDEHIFLAPLSQCCTLRKSTYQKLKAVKHGKILSKRLQTELGKDPLAPVLDNVWFTAIERRLKIILDTIDRCAKANGGLDNVLVHE